MHPVRFTIARRPKSKPNYVGRSGPVLTYLVLGVVSTCTFCGLDFVWGQGGGNFGS